MTNSTSPSFECMINVLNSSTHGNSVTSTATDSVIGTPMIGHDVFHSIANNLVNKIIKHNPEVIPILIQYDVNLDNPSSFDCKGERIAILTQEFVKSFWIKSNGDHNYLMCDSNKIPTFNNLTRQVFWHSILILIWIYVGISLVNLIIVCLIYIHQNS
jgi:hypothetical protein